MCLISKPREEAPAHRTTAERLGSDRDIDLSRFRSCGVLSGAALAWPLEESGFDPWQHQRTSKIKQTNKKGTGELDLFICGAESMLN